VSTECLLYKIGSTNRNVLSDLKITKLFSLRLGLCASNCLHYGSALAGTSSFTGYNKVAQETGSEFFLMTVPKRNPTETQVPAQNDQHDRVGDGRG